MAGNLSADQALVRKLNTSLLLNLLRRSAPLSRAELASLSGLNRSTVSQIVNNLVEGGFILETDLQSDRIGRPGMLLELNPRGGFLVGLEIGVDYLAILLTDFVAQALWQARIPTDSAEDRDLLLERAIGCTQEAIRRGLEAGLPPLGIGVGVPGLVDFERGRLEFAPNLGWRDVPLRQIWSERFQLPTLVENEANAAALGEYYFGAAFRTENFIYLSTGIGLGGGIVLDGKLLRGAGGFASEIGHVAMDPDGELCACGKRGCWETQVSPPHFIARLADRLRRGERSQFPGLIAPPQDEITLDTVVEAVRQRDPLVCSILDEVARDLGAGIANLVNILNPQMVVLGGVLTQASEFLLPTIIETARSKSLSPSFSGVRIVPSRYAQQACLYGAVALVLDELLREPNLLTRNTYGE